MSTKVHTGLSKYILGFALSVILTVIAFAVVMCDWMNGWSIGSKVLFLFGLALIQMFTQIVFFLHLDEGVDAKWNVGAMWFSALCAFIIIGGLWATMQHLNYNMMGGSGRVVRDTVFYHLDSIPGSENTISTNENVG